MEEKEGGIKRGKRGGVIKEKQEGDRIYKNESTKMKERTEKGIEGMMRKLMREEWGEIKEE